MAKEPIEVDALKHAEAKRKNIPTAEFVAARLRVTQSRSRSAARVICMFRGLSRGPNFSLIFRGPAAREVVPAGNLDRVRSGSFPAGLEKAQRRSGAHITRDLFRAAHGAIPGRLPREGAALDSHNVYYGTKGWFGTEP